MTIYFNPSYDSSVFLSPADCGLGKAFQGQEALLSELELRAGLTCADNEHADRVIAYMEAMQATLNAAPDGTLFYAESFGRDDFGTAELMLGWRDALVKVGWNGQPAGDSEKIRVLSLIETHFNCPGSADRWRAILAEASKRPILNPTDRILVQCREDDLDPVLQVLFDSINAQYTTPVVNYPPTEHPFTQEDASRCRILTFDNEYTAHEWIATQELGGDDVVAEADEALLGDLLHTLGKPGIGASDEEIGAVMRLLPLGLSLFKFPADISYLQSYLQSPRTPLEKIYIQEHKKDGSPYYVSVVRRLFDHICSEGGFGPGWQEILDGAKYDFDGNPIPDKERNAVLEFIGMWEKSKGLPAGEAPVAGVTAFIKGLDKWAGKSILPDNPLIAQFQALQRQCGAMLRLLNKWQGNTIPVSRLARWAGHICTPINISSDYARIGSMNVVGNVADIYSPAKHLIWFAATTENVVPFEYDFLSPSEAAALSSAGILIPKKEQAARNDKAYKIEGLSRCKDVTIVTCQRISGVETVPSALLAEIQVYVKPQEGTPVKKTETAPVETDHGKAAVHHFDPKILEGFSRDAESYSSINELLMRPLDYLLDHVKGYSQYGIKEVADLSTIEGNVAHAYFERLGKNCALEPEAMKKMHRDQYDTLLDEVISEKGLSLCLEENLLEKKSFRVGLKESIEILLGIIIENGLAIEGLELERTAETENIGHVLAKIDCLLKDPADGRYVIIDFKYNAGKAYETKIKENRELQLAIYREVVKKTLGEVKFVGYYAIPRKTLFTPDNVLKYNPAIVVVEQDSKAELFNMAANGYVYRRGQLHDGILEEGEGMPLADLDYNLQPDVYPLEPDYDKKDLKARAFGDKNITLKGGLQ